MAIDDAQRSAISRIYVPEVGRGTGFLIDTGIVMTAAHVVWTGKDTRKCFTGDIQLRFYQGDGTNVLVTGRVNDGDFHYIDGKQDWALVTIAPPDVAKVRATPFELRPLARGYDTPWETWGFSEDHSIVGARYGGTILATAGRIELKADAGRPSGLSGAPVIVDGSVQGMLLEAERTEVTERLYAQCVSKFASHLRAFRPTPAFIANVAALLDPVPAGLLPVAAQYLGRDLDATVAKDRHREALAATLLACGLTLELDKAYNALLELDKHLTADAAEEIIELAAKNWVERRAARKLRERLDEKREAVVNTSHVAIGTWYLHRAGCLRGDEEGSGNGKFMRHASVHIDDANPDVVKERVAAALEKLFPDYDPFDIATVMAQHDHTARPIVLVLPWPLPRSTLDYVRNALGIAQVHFVLLPGDAPGDAVRAEFATSLVEPELHAATAADALKARESARQRVRNNKSTFKGKA